MYECTKNIVFTTHCGMHVITTLYSSHAVYVLYVNMSVLHLHVAIYISYSSIAPSTGTGQDVVYASIPDLSKIATTSSRHTYESLNNGVLEGQNNMNMNMLMLLTVILCL